MSAARAATRRADPQARSAHNPRWLVLPYSRRCRPTLRWALVPPPRARYCRCPNNRRAVRRRRWRSRDPTLRTAQANPRRRLARPSCRWHRRAGHARRTCGAWVRTKSQNPAIRRPRSLLEIHRHRRRVRRSSNSSNGASRTTLARRRGLTSSRAKRHRHARWPEQGPRRVRARSHRMGRRSRARLTSAFPPSCVTSSRPGEPLSRRYNVSASSAAIAAM